MSKAACFSTSYSSGSSFPREVPSTTGRSAVRGGRSRPAAEPSRARGLRPRAGAAAPAPPPPAMRVARRVQPGRSMTAIGIMPAMSRQPRQRWKLARLSAPMIQTKRTPGKRRLQIATACRRCSGRRSASSNDGDVDARDGREAVPQRHPLAPSAASSPWSFSGLPGVTSHQTGRARGASAPSG